MAVAALVERPGDVVAHGRGSRSVTDGKRDFHALIRSGPYYAKESDMAGGRIDGLALARGWPVAQAIVRCAQMRATLDHPPRNAFAGRRLVNSRIGRYAACIVAAAGADPWHAG